MPGGAGTPGGYQADWGGTTTTTNGGKGPSRPKDFKTPTIKKPTTTGDQMATGKYKSNIKPTGLLTGAAWGIDQLIGPHTYKINKAKRTKFAQDEGLTRDWAKTHQWGKDPTLNVMSTQGKDYLKEAGYGPFQDKSPDRGGGEGQRCPDGSMPPCTPVATGATTTPTTTTPPGTGWQFYPTNSNYITGEGYDEGGGVKFGPPPKKGPNPQVPPVKFSRGGGCAIRGTKFSGVK